MATPNLSNANKMSPAEHEAKQLELNNAAKTAIAYYTKAMHGDPSINHSGIFKMVNDAVRATLAFQKGVSPENVLDTDIRKYAAELGKKHKGGHSKRGNKRRTKRSSKRRHSRRK